MDCKTCRLCSTSSTDLCLNIFSEDGIKMEMVDILSEHLKCDISEADPLPNVVCHVCWETTKSFHELYKKSKEVQEKFLNSLVKIESDPIDIEFSTSDVECIPIVEEIDLIKLEQNQIANSSGESDKELPKDNNVNGSDADEFDDDNNGDNNDPENDNDCKTKEKKKKRKPSQAKKKNEEYQKKFNENRHLFDMSCDCCPKVFESLSEAQKHYLNEHKKIRGYIKSTSGKKLFLRCGVAEYIDRHVNPDNFKCTKCDRTFQSQYYLGEHTRKHQKLVIKPKEKLFQCDICKKAFAKEKSLQLHKKLHENDPPDREMYDQFIADNFDMSCDRCDAKFTAYQDARDHYKDKHNYDHGYIKCCGKKLNKPSYIRIHINTHLYSQTFKCDLCDKTFKARRDMVNHKFRHKKLICDYCGKTFGVKKSLKNHLFTNHVSSEPKFECEICHKKFQLQSLLKYHNYAVHREKKASVCCELCGKSFYAKFYLDKHMVTAHTDKSERLAMRTQCEHCGEWLMSNSGIYHHKQLHTSGIQKCEQCGMELPNRPALMGHIRQYHRAHKFKCSYCEKTFSIGSKLRKHEEFHTRHKTYPCEFCPKIFNLENSLRTHKQRSHKEEFEISKQNKKSAKNFPIQNLN